MRIRSRRGRLSEPRLRAIVERGDLAPAALPPAAVLCIRRLGLVAPRAWQAAARDAIADLAAHAARPSHGFVPASAEAVLFADRAELLAALARDWCGGRVHACWWWRALFRTGDDAAVVIAAWRDAPQAVPAALDLAAEWQVVVPFVARLPDHVADKFTAGIAATFGVPSPAASRIARQSQRRAEHSASVMAERAQAEPVAASRFDDQRTQRAALAALARWTSEIADANLSTAQRRFAYTALVLHRAPAFRRAELLSPAVLDEIATTSFVRTPPSLPTTANVRSDEHDSDSIPSTADSSPLLANGAQAHGQQIDSTGDCGIVTSAENRVTGRDTATAIAKPRCDELLDRSIETAFGGVFYLLNAAIAMGLYGDFTTPADRGLPLSPWHCLLLLARRLVADDALERDPVAALLTRLAAGESGEGDPLTQGWHNEWADWFAPFVARRLAAALGVEPGRAGNLVVRRRARVRLLQAHVDVVFALDDVSIEIRCAGLDRDPGFVPAAGRTITFIYV
jgi:hypothetical protein